MPGSVRHFPFLESALLVLVVSTAVLLIWQHFGMDSVYEIGAANGHLIISNDDKIDDGNSIVSISYPGQTPTMNCQLRAKYQYPYCGIIFKLGTSMDRGVDLSNYDSVSFNIGFQGKGAHNVRFFLRNFEPGVSNASDMRTLKVNELEFELPPDGRVNIPFRFLRVASWWVSERGIAWFNTDTRIDNVSSLELQTGSNALPGEFQLAVHELKFHGKWISSEHLMASLVAAWVVFGLVALSAELLHFRLRLLATRSHLARVQSLNKALKLETVELAGQARTDTLTGALNREGLREFLSKKLNLVRGANTGICLIFTDLDHFKQVNDSFGHATGDVVLRQFSQLIQSKIRDRDRIVRWGGEEFLIVCTDIDIHVAGRIAEKLRLNVMNHVWPNELKVTSSFGVSVYVPGEDFGETIKRADTALYRAKGKGRNCVESG